MSRVELLRMRRTLSPDRPRRPGKRRLMMQRWPMRWVAYQHMIRTRRPTRKRTMAPVTR